MAVISFRTPQEGLEQYQKAIDMMTLIHEIAHNPAVAGIISDLSGKLTAAQQLSDAKIKQASDAEELIAQSKEFLEEFEKTKSLHESEIRANRAEVDKNNQKLQNDQLSLASEKLNHAASVKKTKEELDAKFLQVNKIKEDAEKIQKEALLLKLNLSNEKLSHEEIVKEFEEFRNRAELELQGKFDSHDENTKKLEADRTEFEARKKKFEDALKG